MLRPILRHFEFEYADGYQFWDKAGRVARDLVQAIPGLRLRNQLIDQRDFFLPSANLELFYGVRIASLRSFTEDAAEFRRQASLLLEFLQEELELQTLTRFRFQLALGWPCQTHDEAHALAMKLLPPQVGQQVKSGEFQAAQLEVRKGATVINHRFSILEITPPPGLARLEGPDPRLPHFVEVVTCENFESLPLREFKTAAHLEDMENRIADDLLKRITSKLDDKPA